MARLGVRAARRAEPRLGVTLAAAGCVLVVLGILVMGGDLGGDLGGDGFNRVPGLVLSVLLVGAGLWAVSAFGDRPAGTAGTVAAVLGVPPAAGFATVDPAALPPVSPDVVLGLSAAAWLGMWAAGPTRSRPFPLGAGLVAAWLFVLEITEGVFAFPFQLLGSLSPTPQPDPFGGFTSGGGQDPFGGGLFGGPTVLPPDPDTLAVLSLVFAAAYLGAARVLDRTGGRGAATPFTVAALVCGPVGVLLWADTLQAAGTGLAFGVLGAVFAVSGALAGRRATTWAGGAMVALGLFLVVADAVGDDADGTTAGAALAVVGAVTVVAAHLLADSLGEPPETVPGPSRFGGPPRAGAGPVPHRAATPPRRPPQVAAPGPPAPAPPPRDAAAGPTAPGRPPDGGHGPAQPPGTSGASPFAPPSPSGSDPPGAGGPSTSGAAATPDPRGDPPPARRRRVLGAPADPEDPPRSP